MDQSSITTWLQKKLKRDRLCAWAIGWGCLLAGCAILALTWGFAYMTSLVALGRLMGYHHWLIYTLPWLLLPLLFWGNARTSREYLSEYSVSAANGSGEVVSFYLPGVGLVSNVNPLAPETIHAGTKIITDILFTGPRVFMAGCRSLGKAVRIGRIDVGNCGAVVTLLMLTGRKMGFQDIVNALGEGFDPATIFPQMALIDGVLFLQAEPAGLTLTQDLRDAIRQEA